MNSEFRFSCLKKECESVLIDFINMLIEAKDYEMKLLRLKYDDIKSNCNLFITINEGFNMKPLSCFLYINK